MYCDEKYVKARIAVEQKGLNWNEILSLAKGLDLWMKTASVDEKKRVMSMVLKDECAKGPKTQTVVVGYVDGKKIGEYKTIVQAAAANGVSKYMISACLGGRVRAAGEINGKRIKWKRVVK